MTAHMGSKKPTKALEPTTNKYQLSKRSKRRMARFIEAYTGTNGRVIDSCKIANIDATTYYNWLENVPGFKTQIIEAEQKTFDDAYQSLIKESNKGNVQASRFILKRDPRFAEDKHIDNRKIIINYPNWT